MSDAVKELARLRAALEAAGDVVYDWDLTADEIFWLDGAPRALGKSAETGAETGQRFLDRIHPLFDEGGKLEKLYPLYEGLRLFGIAHQQRPEQKRGDDVERQVLIQPFNYSQ